MCIRDSVGTDATATCGECSGVEACSESSEAEACGESSGVEACGESSAAEACRESSEDMLESERNMTNKIENAWVCTLKPQIVDAWLCPA